MVMGLGTEEGDVCGRDGCEGVIELQKADNCSCHLCAPCSACVNRNLHCMDCDWEAAEYVFNDHVVTENKATHIFEAWKPRPLDPTKIDWHNKPHTHFTMIKEGVYPEGATADEVRKVVDGTFGGRFEYFRDGKFKFIAYTD